MFLLDIINPYVPLYNNNDSRDNDHDEDGDNESCTQFSNYTNN